MERKTERVIIKPSFNNFLQKRLPLNFKIVPDLRWGQEPGEGAFILKRYNCDSLKYKFLSNFGISDYVGGEEVATMSVLGDPRVELDESLDLAEHPTIARELLGEPAQEYADLSGKKVLVHFREREEVEGAKESRDVVVIDTYSPSESK